MKIDPIAMQNILNTYKSNTVSRPAGKIAQGKVDEVSVSEDALSFSAIFTSLKEQLEIRTPAEQAHIAEVSRLVKDGQYKVDSLKVAESILEDIYIKEV